MGQTLHLQPHQESAMSADPSIDAILIQWGDRLFYLGNRIVKSHTSRLRSGTSAEGRPATSTCRFGGAKAGEEFA